jgi:phosphoglycerol transferase MdoB-like AlkP superfamily enzyme
VKKRKSIAAVLLIIATLLGVSFFLNIDFPQRFEAYFKRAYYNQFGPLALIVELLIAGYYLLVGHKKTNFALALFGFTTLLDPIFDQIGLFDSIVPLYGTIILSLCGLFSLWLAFANPFELKRLSRLVALISVILGVLVELFFNYF